MPSHPLSVADFKEALALYEVHGTEYAAADALGISRSAFANRIRQARAWREREESLDPYIKDGLEEYGVTDLSGVDGGWLIKQDGEGGRLSLRFSVSKGGADSLMATLKDDLDDWPTGGYEGVKEAQPDPSGGLLVIDLADVHVGKLCVTSETGYSYDSDVAVQRMLEGTKALLRKSQGHGIARVLMVLGNDILHIDKPDRKTTSGTPQDTHGSIHSMYRDAQAAYVACIEACAADYPVDLVYCPSNHDWMLGWALANSIGAWFRNHPNVTATPYNLSENHRKYYRYESNLIGLTHGDGAKESDLYPLMMTEARAHISDCAHKYWLLHHVHHKMRKAKGLTSHDREKDHIGLTMVKSGAGMQEGDNIEIEYVRSPSPPDGWHSRNGYVNRQAVECFIYDPYDGQYARFTNWY